MWRRQSPSDTSRAEGWNRSRRGWAHLDLFSCWNLKYSGKPWPLEATPRTCVSGPHDGPALPVLSHRPWGTMSSRWVNIWLLSWAFLERAMFQVGSCAGWEGGKRKAMFRSPCSQARSLGLLPVSHWKWWGEILLSLQGSQVNRVVKPSGNEARWVT